MSRFCLLTWMGEKQMPLRACEHVQSRQKLQCRLHSLWQIVHIKMHFSASAWQSHISFNVKSKNRSHWPYNFIKGTGSAQLWKVLFSWGYQTGRNVSKKTAKTAKIRKLYVTIECSISGYPSCISTFSLHSYWIGIPVLHTIRSHHMS